ncbi:PEP-CTERM putative exosortase interaction domain-containing protein [Cylindrospermum stagnale PCC 7417]|uniref:PEP-CTERM putative exosortase interaction domain-containing protein n=1 Tax=Cylindrospermum stagnale PCC 7417 TaxID=56107 RepID=K9X440_9NOST|nr:PEP-CTERM sorting domain-containing protein [Cylindrospermum stagnale]AFZ26826.1 PEP-CTERM putative exosortase interaction domain-containing protein [Cylindrospermum stagnale PCC 7417]
MKFLTKVITLSSLATSIMLVANPAQAVIITYTDQASFLNAIYPDYYLETFESVPLDTATLSPINFSNGTYSYSASAANDFFPAGSGSDHWLSTDESTDPIIFSNFSPTITAIGGFFFGSEIDGALIPGIITASVNEGSSSQSITTNSTTNFFGFISDDGTPLTSLVASTTEINTDEFVWPTVNNLIVGQASQASQPVPEPANIFGLSIGIGFGFILKRRFTKSNKIIG